MKRLFATIALCTLLAAGLFVWADGGPTGTGSDTVVTGAVVQQSAQLPATQVIGAGGTIAADACGKFKAVSAAGAVSTSATNAITAPTAGNLGCHMVICNVGGTNTITFKHSTANLTSTGADLALAANGCAGFVSNGTVWYQTSVMTTSS